MSSNTHPIIISSDTDMEDTLSLPTLVSSSVDSTPDLSHIPSDVETEPFEEGEVVPTPPLSPLIRRRNRVVPIIQPGQDIPFGRVYRLSPNGPLRKLTARKRVRSLTLAPRVPATHVLPPSSASPIHRPIQHTPVLPLRRRETARKRVIFHSPSSPSSPSSPTSSLRSSSSSSSSSTGAALALLHFRDSIPISDLPLKKRARFDTPSPFATETTPPTRFEVGESSRAVAARQSTATTTTLETRLDRQQERSDRVLDHLEEIPLDRVEAMEEDIEGLVLGRVSIDVSYQGLETRQRVDREHITELRQEIPELFDRAQMLQDEQQRQAHELASARASIATWESRDVTTQLQISDLTDMVVSLAAQVRELQSRSGGAPGDA